jgi:hypothetical protein
VTINKLHSHQIIKKMKKIAYLFVAFAFFGVIALSSCKTKTTEPAVDETVIEEVTAPVDTVAVPVDSVATPVVE